MANDSSNRIDELDNEIRALCKTRTQVIKTTRKDKIKEVRKIIKDYNITYAMLSSAIASPKKLDNAVIGVRRTRNGPFNGDKIRKLKIKGLTARAIAKEMGCSPGTVYAHLKPLTAVVRD